MDDLTILEHMEAYAIPYKHRSGALVASKWANSPKEALEMVQAVHRKAGLASVVGAIEYGPARLLDPQPFSKRATAPKASTIQDIGELSLGIAA